MHDVIDHSDFQNSFKVLMTSYEVRVRVESKSCMSRVESESESKGVGLESESNKIGTRVQLESESRDSSPHLCSDIDALQYN